MVKGVNESRPRTTESRDVTQHHSSQTLELFESFNLVDRRVARHTIATIMTGLRHKYEKSVKVTTALMSSYLVKYVGNKFPSAVFSSRAGHGPKDAKIQKYEKTRTFFIYNLASTLQPVSLVHLAPESSVAIENPRAPRHDPVLCMSFVEPSVDRSGHMMMQKVQAVYEWTR